MRSSLLAVLTLSAPVFTAAAQEPPGRAEVLVLGVYHMANPGRDVFNMQADDVLSVRRQQEIAQLIEVLKRFGPTKIAIESGVWGDRATREYAAYLAGTYTLTRNENDQIGYRLARELGHTTIHAVDTDGDFPWPRVVNYAKGSGRSAEFDEVQRETGAMVKAQGDYLASHSILETLLYMNEDAKVARDVGLYYRLAHFGEPGDWAGADLVSDWFRRNMRIYSNIVRLIDSPRERVLVIYGAGHLGWLRLAIAGDPTLRLRTLAEFAR